jgi:hypothetical protein
MLRFAELALFVAPFVAFFAWRVIGVEAGPPFWLVLSAGCMVLLLAGVLFWMREEETLPPSAGYVPAQLEGNKIRPGQSSSQ